MLYAWDPITGIMSDLSYVLYADDLTRIGTCSSGPNAVHRLRTWDTNLDQHIQVIGVFQDIGKRQLMFRFHGPGSQQNYYYVRTACANKMYRANLVRRSSI